MRLTTQIITISPPNQLPRAQYGVYSGPELPILDQSKLKSSIPRPSYAPPSARIHQLWLLMRQSTATDVRVGKISMGKNCHRNVTRKMTRNTCNLRRVSCFCDAERVVEVESYRVVNSWTMTRVPGQYMAGRATRRLYSIPEVSSCCKHQHTCQTKADALSCQ